MNPVPLVELGPSSTSESGDCPHRTNDFSISPCRQQRRWQHAADKPSTAATRRNRSGQARFTEGPWRRYPNHAPVLRSQSAHDGAKSQHHLVQAKRLGHVVIPADGQPMIRFATASFAVRKCTNGPSVPSLSLRAAAIHRGQEE